MDEQRLGIRIPKDREHRLAMARMDSAHLRQMPGLIIIGAQKSGTTSLRRYLSEHPDVGTTIAKEVHFFSWRYERGMDWYLAHFPEVGETEVVVEASPSYLSHPSAPERVRAVMPDVKLVALLRNPIDRAYSQYQMNVRKGNETLSFDEAIAQEPQRLRSLSAGSATYWRDSTFVSYLSRGIYADQLSRWLEIFPREQLLIISSEAFFERPKEVLDRTLDFLGLRPWHPDSFKVHNQGSYGEMRPETRVRLAAFFAPRNQELYDLLGHDFGWDA